MTDKVDNSDVKTVTKKCLLPKNLNEKFGTQRHLSVNLSSGCLNSQSLRDEDDQHENCKDKGRIDSDVNDLAKIEPKVDVRTIIDQFDGEIKKIKRKDVKLSPKSKLTPLRSTKLEKARKTLNLGKLGMSPNLKSPKVRQEVKIGKKSKLGNTEMRPQIEPNKVKSIVNAFEMNTIVNESTHNMNESNSKKIAVNAFSELMNSKGEGASPTPVKKKAKRLDKVKPTGLMKIDRWISKEKS